MTSVIIDFNNLCVRHYFIKDIEAETNPNIKLWKYNVIESVYNALFKEPNINEMILAIDDSRSWRKKFWPRYKESREGKRKTAKIDWNIFHKEYEKFHNEIQEYLPFKTLKIRNAEADDIIGAICLEKNKNFIIISNDEDFQQLICSRIKLYHPLRQKYIEIDSAEDFIVKKCLTGQPKDDIFNIKTALDWPKDKRKPGFGEVSAKKVMSEGYENWLKKENLEERFRINRILIDLKLIPKSLKSHIINEYDNYKLPDPSLYYDFFKNNNFTGFLEKIHSVEEKLMKLY